MLMSFCRLLAIACCMPALFLYQLGVNLVTGLVFGVIDAVSRVMVLWGEARAGRLGPGTFLVYAPGCLLMCLLLNINLYLALAFLHDGMSRIRQFWRAYA